jgi:SAM-dependent methyltransferase
MSVFDSSYAAAYDLLYRDKDYSGEAKFVSDLARKHLPEAKTLLDLGSGTGRHDVEFAALGYDVTGVERSEEMLAKARESAAGAVRFALGDIRTVRLGHQFDVVTSLFHVVSYQTSNSDVRQAMETARAHTKPGGIFIFDFWYGPAVLAEQPATRIKRLEDERVSLTRLAEPVLCTGENLVEVHYEMFVQEKGSAEVKRFRERHDMRYFSLPEIQWIAEEGGWKLEETGEWMTAAEPSEKTWGVYVVLRKAAGAAKAEKLKC